MESPRPEAKETEEKEKMKLFKWSDVDYLTTSYHDNGGLVVIAETLERARELISDKCPGKHWSHDAVPHRCSAMDTDPDDTFEIFGGSETIWVFPNAGCC